VGYKATARLGTADPIAHLALPVAATDASVVAVAVERSSGRATSELSLPLGGFLLDLFTFPDPPWATGPGTTPPTEPTMKPIEIAGLRLTPLTETDWAFAPLTAGVARAPDGRPQLTLLESGATGHLAVTTTLLASDVQQEQARAALDRDHDADEGQLTLAPEDIRATGVTLLLHGPDDEWAPLATAEPSGTFLQECAFSVPLDPVQLEVVRRATHGQDGLLRVTYELVSQPRAAASASAGSSSSTSMTTTTITRSSPSGSEPATTITTHHDEQATTAATSTAPHETAWTVTTDAASWELGPPA
jgi:hypothetical protein